MSDYQLCKEELGALVAVCILVGIIVGMAMVAPQELKNPDFDPLWNATDQ